MRIATFQSYRSHTDPQQKVSGGEFGKTKVDLKTLKTFGIFQQKSLDVINPIIKPLDVIILIIKHQQLGFDCSY